MHKLHILCWVHACVDHSEPFSTEAEAPLSSGACGQMSSKGPFTISQLGLLASPCVEALLVLSPALSPFLLFSN